MASFAAVWNPLAISPHRLLVFYNSTKGNLGLRQWEPEQKQWGTFWDERAESVKGNVKVGGGFAAFVWRNWIRAYGIVSVIEKDVDTKYISLLSPVTQSLGVKTNYTRLAGTSTGKASKDEKAWLYYLSADPPEIHERAVHSGSSKLVIKNNLMKEASPAALTHLAACYSQKINKRFVFFQDSESYIFAYDIEGNRGDGKIKDSNGALKGTPIAATCFTMNSADVIVAYWVRQSDKYLVRGHSSDAGINWKIEMLSEASMPSLETLAVASNEDLQTNVLVFTDVEGGIQSYSDDWKDIRI